MIYIHKQDPSKQVVNEIVQVKKDADWDKLDKKNLQKVREAFDRLNKPIIRQQLLIEQRGLCAYCMRRIRDDSHTTIEHMRPIRLYGDYALDYKNMLACCDGGRKGETPRVLCCDAAKGDQPLTINPYDEHQMAQIRYNRNGRVFIWPENALIQSDLDEVLHLNGNVDKNGETIQDTSTRLVYSRKKVYDRYVDFVKAATKRNKNMRAILEKKRDELQNAQPYEEFTGVWLYFLNRKLRSL